MAELKELFVIKSVENNRFYIEDWRRDKNWTLDIKEAETYNSYKEASEKLSTDNNIPEGMYQIEKFFKKPEIDWDEEEN